MTDPDDAVRVRFQRDLDVIVGRGKASRVVGTWKRARYRQRHASQGFQFTSDDGQVSDVFERQHEMRAPAIASFRRKFGTCPNT